MRLLNRWSIIIPAAAIPAAMLLSTINSSEHRAQAKLAQALDVRSVDVTFEPMRYRGVLCGRFRRKADKGMTLWHPFVYIDHYSAESPQAARLLVGGGNTAARAKYHCDPA